MRQSEHHAWVRPNGRASTDYEWLKTAREEDLAFECLRRIPDFHVACESVRAGTVEPEWVCAEFGLHHFKPWDELREAGKGRPKFSASHVSVYRHKPDQDFRRAVVRKGQVILVVHLDQMARSKRNANHLKAQVSALIDREFDMYRESVGTAYSVPPKHDKGAYATNVEACIQLHDLDAAGGLDDESIADLVPYLSLLKPKTDSDDPEPLRGRLISLRRRNKLIFEGHGYRRFLVANGDK